MKRIALLVAALALAACDKPGMSTAGPAHASMADSIAALNLQLAQARATAQQQDSLMQGFTQTTKLVEDIDRELSHVKGLSSHVPLDVNGESSSDPKAAYRASLLGKVHQATVLLRESRGRVHILSQQNTALKGQIAQYEQTITSLQAMIDRQTQQIAELTGRVDSLTTANTTLASANAAIGDTVTTLRHEANTVYYVVGTKQELMRRGIIVEEGSRFLFFGHKALVPARTLDPSAFTAMNKWSSDPIMLPTPTQRFRIVSRQDASLIAADKAPDGKEVSALHITDPAQFWASSKFLIIVDG